MTKDDCFRVGSILKTKGLKGELNIYVDFDGLESIKITTIFIETMGKLVPYFVTSIKYLQKNICKTVLDSYWLFLNFKLKIVTVILLRVYKYNS